MNHLCVQHIHTVRAIPALLTVYCSACAQVTLVLLHSGPKEKESDAGESDKPKEAVKSFFEVKRGKFSIICASDIH